MITVKNLSKSFGKRQLFTISSFSLPQGITCLGGPSGCGKTTFARILSGLEKADHGIVQGVIGSPSILFQEPRLLPSLTAGENVACVSKKKDAANRAFSLLTTLGFSETDLNKKTDELSGGMAQRVAIARTLLFAEEQGGNLLILDEPFRGLDPKRRQEVAKMIQTRFSDRHVLIITHDEVDSALFNTKLILFQELVKESM